MGAWFSPRRWDSQLQPPESTEAGPAHQVRTHLPSSSGTAASPPASQAPRGCPVPQPSLACFPGVLALVVASEGFNWDPAQSALCCGKTREGSTESSVGKGVVGSEPLVLADSEFSEGFRPWHSRPGVVAGGGRVHAAALLAVAGRFAAGLCYAWSHAQREECGRGGCGRGGCGPFSSP